LGLAQNNFAFGHTYKVVFSIHTAEHNWLRAFLCAFFRGLTVEHLVHDVLVMNALTRVLALSASNSVGTVDPLPTLHAPAFEALLLRTNLGLALYNQQQEFYYASTSLCHMLGYPHSTVCAKGPALLYQLITPTDRPRVDAMLAHAGELLEEHRPHYPRISFDYHLLAGTGHLKRMYQHMLPNVVTFGQRTYTLFLLHDFTGLKSAPHLNYAVSYLSGADEFTTLYAGRMNAPCPYPFTPGEKKLLAALLKGTSLAAYARQQQVSIETLKKHRSNLLQKSGSPNLLALLHECLRHDWP
jgi:DNA-binding CsgD family transcriptional regulator